MDQYVITAAQAQAFADITYRQLDHWVRKGWVTPSVAAGKGKSNRRLFGVEDVLRLGLLCHLGRSKRNLTALGPEAATVDLNVDFVVIDAADVMSTVSGRDKFVTTVCGAGAFTVFDVERFRRLVTTALAPSQATLKNEMSGGLLRSVQ